jgi:hypothetical protein
VCPAAGRHDSSESDSTFEGAIGKVAVYDTILSDQEIRDTCEAMIS